MKKWHVILRLKCKAWLASLIISLATCIGNPEVSHAEAQWQKALEPWNWSFPRDHGQHPDFQTEWWYFTGNVRTKAGRDFGYELTIFRYGIQRVPAQQESRWAMRDVWFGHFTVTDIEMGRFFQADRSGRGALGQDGASQETMEVWLGNREWLIEPLPG